MERNTISKTVELPFHILASALTMTSDDGGYKLFIGHSQNASYLKKIYTDQFRPEKPMFSAGVPEH